TSPDRPSRHRRSRSIASGINTTFTLAAAARALRLTGATLVDCYGSGRRIGGSMRCSKKPRKNGTFSFSATILLPNFFPIVSRAGCGPAPGAGAGDCLSGKHRTSGGLQFSGLLKLSREHLCRVQGGREFSISVF